jgi:hypothetical protein
MDNFRATTTFRRRTPEIAGVRLRPQAQWFQ